MIVEQLLEEGSFQHYFFDSKDKISSVILILETEKRKKRYMVM